MGFFADLSTGAYALALFGTFCLGLSKTGFPGLSIINVIILAEVLGTKTSVGVVLPLLVVADLTVYPTFRKYASWKKVWPLLPPAIIGVLVGVYLLDTISDSVARRTLGAIVLLMLALQFIRGRYPDFIRSMPDALAFRWGTGLGIGVSTTLANAAGPVYALYALVRKIPKEDFLGIGARFFLFLNLFKIPFNTGLDLINQESLLTDLVLVPGVLIGILVGKTLIQKVPQGLFEKLLILFTLVAGVRLLLF